MVKAVFVVSVVELHRNEARKIIAEPICDSRGRYKSYSQYTPSGKLEMLITNPTAAAYFKPGQTLELLIREDEPEPDSVP